MASQSFRLFDLPPEVRELIYEQLLRPEANKRKDEDSRTHYKWDLSLLRANRRLHDETANVFYRLNHFVAIETPWPQAQEHIQTEGYIPALLTADRADRFEHYALLVKIDAPDFNVFSEQVRRLVIHLDDLSAFAEFWGYQNLSTPGLNSHLRLVLHLSNARPVPGETQARPLQLSVQKAMIEPFGQVKDLQQVEINGLHDQKLEEALREQMAVPNKSAEDCLDEAMSLKELGNKYLLEKDHWRAVHLYEASFRELHVICDGRRRSVWGDRYFQREMLYGKHKGQNGGLRRLIMRVQLVANIIFAYVRMGTMEGYDWAHFWGMRTINLMRGSIEDEIDEPLLDFPASHELGKIYYRTGVASRHLGNEKEARGLLKVAMTYLPNDPQVRSEYAQLG